MLLGFLVFLGVNTQKMARIFLQKKPVEMRVRKK
jgi:hypothetical protein